MLKVIETSRDTLRFYGTLNGKYNIGATLPVGPAVITIDVVQYRSHTASYYVQFDGQHQFGGFADYLPRVLARLTRDLHLTPLLP